MMHFFQTHPEFVLISVAVVLVAVLIGVFFWGITTLISVLNGAIGSGSGQNQAVGFDIKGARVLDLKGAPQ